MTPLGREIDAGFVNIKEKIKIPRGQEQNGRDLPKVHIQLSIIFNCGLN